MVRIGGTFLNLVLMLGVLLLMGFVWRESVVETTANIYMTSHGLEDAQFEVTTVGRTEMVIENISLGGGALSARRLRLTYGAGELFSRRLDTLQIEGLKVDASDKSLARLEDLASGGDGAAVSLRKIRFLDAIVTLAAPVAGEIALNGELVPSGGALQAALEIGVDLGRLTGALTLHSGSLEEGGVAQIAGRGKFDLAGAALPGGTGVIQTGDAWFKVAGDARIPAADAMSVETWLTAALALNGDLHVRKLTTSAAAGVVSADLDWILHGGEDGLRVDLAHSARLTMEGLSRDMLEALSLPLDGAARDLVVEMAPGPAAAWRPRGEGGVADFSGNFSTTLGDAAARIGAGLKIEHAAAWRLSSPAKVALDIDAIGIAFSGPAGAALLQRANWGGVGTYAWDGELALSGPFSIAARGVRGAGFAADEVGAEGVVRLRGRNIEDWSLSTEPGLAIALTDAVALDQVEFTGPAQMLAERLEVTSTGSATRLGVSVTLDRISGIVPGDSDSDSIAFADAGGRLVADLVLDDRVRGILNLEEARWTLPDQAIRISSVNAKLPISADGGPEEVGFSAEVSDAGKELRFKPIRFDLKGERDGMRIEVVGAAETLDRKVRLPVKGSANLSTLTGEIQAGPSRIAFQPDGLTPGALGPRLAAFRNVRGWVDVSIASALDAKGLMTMSMRLKFDDLSARIGDLDVVGLAGDLRFGHLSPLATAGSQRLTARRIFAGAPMENARINFSIPLRSRGLTVRLHEVRGGVAGGEVLIEDATWDSHAKFNEFAVQVRGVSIERLVREWRIEGVSGTGRLSGVIPVRVGSAGVAIDDGRLDSAEAGVVRVDWGAAREQMVRAGEQVALAVTALEDFHYDALSIGLKQAADGGLTLAIGLDGANPKVLDGHPFRFNVNLSGDLTELVAAVRDGRRIGGDLIQGGLGGGR